MLSAIITPVLWTSAGLIGLAVIVLAFIGAYFLIVAKLHDK